MSKWYRMSSLHRGFITMTAGVSLCAGLLASQSPGSQPPVGPQTPPPVGRPSGSGTQASEQSKPEPESKAETHITPDEAKQLFGLVDQLIKFSSQETGLPIKS